MKLVLTPLINFNSHQHIDTTLPDNAQLLIKPQILFKGFQKLDHRISVQKYRSGFKIATLRFTNERFRHDYMNWVFSNYSDSIINRRRIQKNERVAIVDWARQFNRHHQYSKIIWIQPIANDHKLAARMKLIAFSYSLGRLSFDFRDSLEAEYNQDYNNSFKALENSEGHRLTDVFKIKFIEYIPEANFQFVYKDLSHRLVDTLRPTQYNSELKRISYQYRALKTSSQAQSDKLNKFKSMYKSVQSSASSQAKTNSQIIIKISNKLQSALDITAANSKRIRSLNKQNQQLKSKLTLTNRASDIYQKSMTSQLASMHNRIANYSSSTINQASHVANISLNPRNSSTSASNPARNDRNIKPKNLKSSVSSINHSKSFNSANSSSSSNSLANSEEYNFRFSDGISLQDSRSWASVSFDKLPVVVSSPSESFSGVKNDKTNLQSNVNLRSNVSSKSHHRRIKWRIFRYPNHKYGKAIVITVIIILLIIFICLIIYK